MGHNGEVKLIAGHRSHRSHSSHRSSSGGGYSSGSSYRSSGSSSSIYTKPAVPATPAKTAATYELGDRVLREGVYGNDVTALVNLLVTKNYLRKGKATMRNGYAVYDSSVKEEKILKDFSVILNYLDNSYLKKVCGDIALEVIKNGCYYGYIIDNKDELCVIINETNINFVIAQSCWILFGLDEDETLFMPISPNIAIALCHHQEDNNQVIYHFDVAKHIEWLNHLSIYSELEHNHQYVYAKSEHDLQNYVAEYKEMKEKTRLLFPKENDAQTMDKLFKLRELFRDIKKFLNHYDSRT
jgi:hypothetical protein